MCGIIEYQVENIFFCFSYSPTIIPQNREVVKVSVLFDLIEKDFTVVPKGKGGRWFTTIEHDSLIIDEENEAFFWNSRGVFGDAYVWLTKIKGITHDNAKEKLSLLQADLAQTYSQIIYNKTETVVYPKLVEIFWENGKTDRGYWYKRGITDQTIDQFQLGSNDGWYLIPLYRDGNFVNFQMRRDLPEKKIKLWYGNFKPVLFNEQVLRISNKVFIVESPTDAILLSQNGLPAVASSSGAGYWDKSWFKKFLWAEEIYIVYDNDEAGFSGMRKVAQMLGVEGCLTYNFKDYPEKFDAGNWFSECGEGGEEFYQMLKEKSRRIYEWV